MAITFISLDTADYPQQSVGTRRQISLATTEATALRSKRTGNVCAGQVSLERGESHENFMGRSSELQNSGIAQSSFAPPIFHCSSHRKIYGEI